MKNNNYPTWLVPLDIDKEALVYKLIEIYKSEQNENLHLRKD